MKRTIHDKDVLREARFRCSDGSEVKVVDFIFPSHMGNVVPWDFSYCDKVIYENEHGRFYVRPATFREYAVELLEAGK